MTWWNSCSLKKRLNFFHVGGLRPPPLKVGRIRGLRNDGLVHGPSCGPMALAHWSRVRPWSMGPGLGPGPAPVHGPRPGPWAWPIGPGSGPGPWAPAHGPGRVKNSFYFVLAKKNVYFFLGFHFNGSWKRWNEITPQMEVTLFQHFPETFK